MLCCLLIESDQDVESSEIADSNVVSTKSYRHRDRVDTGEMDGDAGLEIWCYLFLNKDSIKQ